MRAAALNTGPSFHLLDHIAPLASILQIPLIVTEEKNLALALHYYPMVRTESMPDLDLKLQSLAARFDILFECKYWAPHLKSLFRDFYQKEMELIFCPHGQSDKGYAERLLHPYAFQDRILLYGDLMQTMLDELGIQARSTRVGNYRLSFYLENQTFYDSIAQAEIFSSLSPQSKTLLYAPTWQDADAATSFFDRTPELLSSLPSDWNLLIKVHPQLEQREVSSYYRMAQRIDACPRARLISEFPPIYPLLVRSDAYLGDYSSVGYDFLYVQKPMFFFTQKSLPEGRLHACGTKIDRAASLFSLIDQATSYKEKQAALYARAFGPFEQPQAIRNRLFGVARGEHEEHP